MTGDVRENRTNLKRISELIEEIRECLDRERIKKRNTDESPVEAEPSSALPQGGTFKRVTVREQKKDRRSKD